MLALLLTASTLCSCGNTDTDTTVPESGVQTDAETQAEAEEKLPDGTLVYYENFDGRELSDDERTTLSQLGWLELKKSDGALTDSTAEANIKEYGDGKALYIENNITNGADSYYRILSAEAMGYFQQRNYTLQYDLEYIRASEPTRYMVITPGYDGDTYMSFHFRNRGNACSQLRVNGSWYRVDVPGENYADNTNENSIITKLLGRTYDEGSIAFRKIPVSIRYVVDWQNGLSVYMRTVSADTASEGKWVLVSRFSEASEGAAFWSPDTFGAALALKIGGKQSGYVDNIMIWTGTGEEPSDKTSTVIDSKTESCYEHTILDADCDNPVHCKYCDHTVGEAQGHEYTDGVCTRCNRTEDNIRNNWTLTPAPAYEGGKKSDELYIGGQDAYDLDFSADKDTKLTVINRTNADEFNVYLAKLEKNGYTKTFENKIEENLYAQYQKDDVLLYAYYTDSLKEARVLIDRSSMTSVDKFGYTYEKKDGETTELYQIGLTYPQSHADDANRANYGMMYVIKTADNSVFIIDGGSYDQVNDEKIDEIMDLLYDITDTEVGGVVRVSGWYITHAHKDHHAGFEMLIKKYSENLKFERIFYNFPTVNGGDPVIANASDLQQWFSRYYSAYIADDEPIFMQIHTGQTFDIADVGVQVLFTHEDLADSDTGVIDVGGDFNNTSAVIKLTFDGKSFMVLGDMSNRADNRIQKMYGEETFKSDIVQAAHHVFNSMPALYRKINAPVALIPQGKEYIYSRDGGMVDTLNSILKYVEGDMAFYASNGTVGLTVAEGEIKKTAEYPPIDVTKAEGLLWRDPSMQ